MQAQDANKAAEIGKHASHGSLFLSSVEQIDLYPILLPYAHYLRQAWEVLKLDGVLCVDGRPTVYLCEAKRFTFEQKCERHKFVWNQGLVPLLILLTPGHVEVFSGVRKPEKTEVPGAALRALIADLGGMADALQLAKMIRSIETGQFFQDRRDFFPPGEAVDRCLVMNLVQAARLLRKAGWTIDRAHALLGRTLFVSFLHQRGFITQRHFPEKVSSLLDIVKDRRVDESKRLLYGQGGLFPTLKQEFNGTMFDSALDEEEREIRKPHLDILADFLGGGDMESGQFTLFSEYDFSVIPVETISAIYEEFMKDADLKRKHDEGAFYTPRHLAETALHIAVENRYNVAASWRVLDPACGSGIFLVAMFNLLAAQWLRDNAAKAKKTKAQALLEILQQQIRGVDVNLDACRISAFSLYLALFEKLIPIDLEEFKAKVRADHFLPPLLWSDRENLKAEPAVIIHGDFLKDELPLTKDYELVIGNPPWESRGKEQIALHFAKRTPEFLCKGGIGCLILPTTILVNRNGTLDGDWFRSVTVEKIVQLADYRKMMFASAIHAGFIIRYANEKPSLEHTVIYETPKVSRFDRRRGIIVVEPDDQKPVSQRELLEASLKKKENQLQSMWSRKFWGSPREEAFLRKLDLFPKLSQAMNRKKWTGGVGFKPYYPGVSPPDSKPINPWKLTDAYLPNSSDFPQLAVLNSELWTLKEGLEQSIHRKKKVSASLEYLHRKPEDSTFAGPMVVFSNGFTKFAFSRTGFLFQDSLRSIVGNETDSDLLRFLTAVLSSRLMQFHAFHSGSSNGIGRDKLHLFESLNLPFALPEDEFAPDNATELIQKAAKILKDVEIRSGSVSKAERATMAEDAKVLLEPLIEEYYTITETERILISDTLELWQPSIHKENLDLDVPALRFPRAEHLQFYGDTIASELNRFSRKPHLSVSVEGMSSEALNLVLITIVFGSKKRPYHQAGGDTELWTKLKEVNEAAIRNNGPLSYLRGFTYFQRDRAYILKPATMRNWCRTAALNDADAVFEYLQGRRA